MRESVRIDWRCAVLKTSLTTQLRRRATQYSLPAIQVAQSRVVRIGRPIVPERDAPDVNSGLSSGLELVALRMTVCQTAETPSRRARDACEAVTYSPSHPGAQVAGQAVGSRNNSGWIFVLPTQDRWSLVFPQLRHTGRSSVFRRPPPHSHCASFSPCQPAGEFEQRASPRFRIWLESQT